MKSVESLEVLISSLKMANATRKCLIEDIAEGVNPITITIIQRQIDLSDKMIRELSEELYDLWDKIAAGLCVTSPSKPKKLSVRNSFSVFLADFKARFNK